MGLCLERSSRHQGRMRVERAKNGRCREGVMESEVRVKPGEEVAGQQDRSLVQDYVLTLAAVKTKLYW